MLCCYTQLWHTRLDDIVHHTMKLIPIIYEITWITYFPSSLYSTQYKHQSVEDRLFLTREKPCAKCSNWSIYGVIFDQNKILPFICLIMWLLIMFEAKWAMGPFGNMICWLVSPTLILSFTRCSSDKAECRGYKEK